MRPDFKSKAKEIVTELEIGPITKDAAAEVIERHLRDSYDSGYEVVRRTVNELPPVDLPWELLEALDILRKPYGAGALACDLVEKSVEKLAMMYGGEIVWENECGLVFDDGAQTLLGEMGLCSRNAEADGYEELQVAITSFDKSQRHALMNSLRGVSVRVTIKKIEGGNI